MARARSAPGVIHAPGVMFIVDPPAATIRHDVLLLEKQIKDYLLPLQLSKQIIIDDVKSAFESETDPVTNVRWKSLSERAERVPRFGILQRTETNRRLYRSVTQKQNYGINKGGVYINQRKVPFYAGYHQQDGRLEGTAPAAGSIQEGLRSMGIRSKSDIVKMAHARAKSTGYPVKHHYVEILEEAKSGEHVEGKQTKIPQRRFLGPSKYAQDLIVKQFDRWAENAIIIYKRSGRVVVRRRVIP